MKGSKTKGWRVVPGGLDGVALWPVLFFSPWVTAHLCSTVSTNALRYFWFHNFFSSFFARATKRHPANGGSASSHLAHQLTTRRRRCKQPNRTTKLDKPPLEVAPTYLWLTSFIYRNYIIQVCFSSTLPDLVFPVSFSPEEKEHRLLPWTLSYSLDL